MISFLSDFIARIKKMFLGNAFFRHFLKWGKQEKPKNILPTPAPHPLYPSGIGGNSPIGYRDSPSVPGGVSLPENPSDNPVSVGINPVGGPIQGYYGPGGLSLSGPDIAPAPGETIKRKRLPTEFHILPDIPEGEPIWKQFGGSSPQKRDEVIRFDPMKKNGFGRVIGGPDSLPPERQKTSMFRTAMEGLKNVFV